MSRLRNKNCIHAGLLLCACIAAFPIAVSGGPSQPNSNQSPTQTSHQYVLESVTAVGGGCATNSSQYSIQDRVMLFAEVADKQGSANYQMMDPNLLAIDSDAPSEPASVDIWSLYE